MTALIRLYDTPCGQQRDESGFTSLHMDKHLQMCGVLALRHRAGLVSLPNSVVHAGYGEVGCQVGCVGRADNEGK